MAVNPPLVRGPKRTGQPQYTVPLDTRWLSRNLVFMWDAGQQQSFGGQGAAGAGMLRNLVPGGTSAFQFDNNAYFTRTSVASGVAGLISGASSTAVRYDAASTFLSGLTELTLMTWFTFGAGDTSSQSLHFRTDNQHSIDIFSQTANTLTWGSDWAGAWNGTSTQTLSGLRDGQPVCIAASINQTGARLFANGVFIGTKAGSAFTTSSSSVQVVGAARVRETGGAAFQRALSDVELLTLTGNPAQLFAPSPAPIPSTILLPRAPVSPASSRLLGTSTGTVPTVSVLPALTKVRISQPQSAVALSNLAKGDGCTFALGANGYNAATQRLPLFIGTGVSFINSKYGIAVEGTPTAQGIGYSANPGFSEFVPAANSFTVLILVRVNSQGTRRFIAGDFIASGNTNQYAIYQTASNQLQVSVGGAFSIFGGVLSTGWHWLENIYDLANSTNTSYIDGVLADANSAPARSTGGTGQFRILSAGEYIAESFDGDIAAFLIFKSVLTKAQRELYKSNPNLAFSRVPVNGWVAP